MYAGVNHYTSTLPRRNVKSATDDCERRKSIDEFAISHGRDEMIRPTYGAYACNTLPRGPYLQYKFNDQHNDNNMRKSQQIEELRSEFLKKPHTKKTTYTNDGHYKTQTLERFSKKDDFRKEFNAPSAHDNMNNFQLKIPPLPTMNYQTLPKSFTTITKYSNNYPVKSRVNTANIHPLHMLQHKKVSSENTLHEQKDYEIHNFPFSSLHHQVSPSASEAAPPPQPFKCQAPVIPRHKLSGSISAGYPLDISSANQLNYVTLDDVLIVRPNGFIAPEGWALLCQTVQALQDLFLADTPSTSRILPLVTPTSLQITSRGRVAFSIIPAGQTIAHDLGRMAYGDAVKHLAPEFLTSSGKKITFSESDIEKMWIYSLGVTLQRTLPSTLPTTVSGHVNDHTSTVPKATFQENQSSLAPLDFVVRSMCCKDVQSRSTLMYLLDLNVERTELRRKPHLIESITPQFNASTFNFNKVSQGEILFRLKYKNLVVSFLVNNSPLTPNHCLICPDIEKNHAQVLTQSSIEFSLNLMKNLQNRHYRIGYNSPGALASVNHLHLHLMLIERDLYVDSAPLNELTSSLYILEDKYPTCGLCVIVREFDCLQQVSAKVFQLVNFLCKRNIPHNIFITNGSFKGTSCQRILIFPRDNRYLLNEKKLSGFNIAFCELSSYVPVGSKEIFNSLTEDVIVISEYCKVHHQVKPFSHTVMELFQQVIHQKGQNIHISSNSDEIKLQEGHKSDTDSGRSSDHGEPFRETSNEEGCKLEIKRIPSLQQAKENYTKICNAVIGQKLPKITAESSSGTLQVIRRKRKRETLRRNTIDINRLELQNAREELLNGSKSATCLLEINLNESFNRKLNEIDFASCGISLPDLHTDAKIAVSPPPLLHVRRPVGNVQTDSKENILAKSMQYIEKGPDFIVKSFVTPKQIDISDAKCQNRRSINVLLLNGHILRIICNPITTTAYHIFQAIMETENCVENFFLGLCALIGGDFVFLPLDLKIYKVAPQAWINMSSKKGNVMENLTFSLYIRIKFYLPTLRGISSLESRHMLYLQLRKSILERHILCTDDDLITLGGLALQAEAGDFKENMKYLEYFTLSHYLPEGVYQKNREMAQYLRNSHYRKKGLLPLEAEHNFIRYVQELKEYGLHLYSAVWMVDEQTSINVFVAISLRGICLFHRNLSPNTNNHLEIYSENSKMMYQRKLYAKFEWLEIENLCYSKHILCIVVRNSESLKAKDTNRIKYKLRMDGRKSYFAFSLSSDHHKFYMTLRNSFASLKMISSELNVPLRRKLNPTDDGEEGLDIPNFVPKIDKPMKPHGNRMRNLKKSMINDNRLIKLRQRFLKRSKSTAEMTSAVDASRHPRISREEVQNKENESPPSIPISANSSPRSATWSRNKVKMGTRVFSSQFLNKSFDNICDNVVNSARSEGSYSIFEQGFSPINENLLEHDFSDGENSLKSTSLGSILYAIDKPCDSPSVGGEAYVIHSSIRSTQNNYSLPNETVSDTLMDKFNNISCSNVANDRVISEIKIIKDRLSDSRNSSFERMKFSTLNPSRLSKKLIRVKNKLLSKSQESVVIDEKKFSGYTLGISIVQGSDNNVYVKNLVPDGPGARNGIKIGDQILAVDGISLLNLPYTESLKLLQTTRNVVELIVSQLANEEPQIKFNPNDECKLVLTESLERKPHNNFDYLRKLQNTKSVERPSITDDSRNCAKLAKVEKTAISKSAPDLPKIIAIIPKEPKLKISTHGKFFGHKKFPATPGKELKGTTSAPLSKPQPLSLPAKCADKQVFI
ncbi:FERM domain [Sergentomyia squamirostris]